MNCPGEALHIIRQRRISVKKTRAIHACNIAFRYAITVTALK
jgi:hypothetical protein